MDTLYADFLKLSVFEQAMIAMAVVTFIGTVIGWFSGLFHHHNEEYAISPDDGRIHRSRANMDKKEVREVGTLAPKEHALPKGVKMKPNPNPQQSSHSGGGYAVIPENKANTKKLYEEVWKRWENACQNCKTQLLPGKVNLRSLENTWQIKCFINCSKCGEVHSMILDRDEVLF